MRAHSPARRWLSRLAHHHHPGTTRFPSAQGNPPRLSQAEAIATRGATEGL